jgi:hypothetical protein
MREPQNCEMKYCGFSKPVSSDEIKFEILGLESLIKQAEERIASLRQTSFLADLVIKSESETLEELFNKE